MDTLRYGIIGTGMMGREHILNLEHVDGVAVTAISDPDEESRRLAAEDVSGDVAVYTDHRDLLAAGGLDAVVVASPNYTHIDVLPDVIDAGVPVLVEKPLCTTLADCKKVMDAAEAAGSLVWVGLEYRYMPPVARLVEEVQAGAAGPVRMVAIREHRFPFLVKVGDWNRFNRYTGGTLVEKCCHFFDLMNLITGSRPVRVLASGAQDVNHLDEVYDGEVPDILDNAYVIVDYESGARALLDLCMFADISQWQEELSVAGDVGKVEAFVPGTFPVPEGGMVRIANRAAGTVVDERVHDERIRFEGLHHGSSYLEHLDFARILRSGAVPGVGLYDGMLSVAVGVAAHRSIDEERVVAVAEVLAEAGIPARA
jgi:predicted dehydrogenase